MRHLARSPRGRLTLSLLLHKIHHIRSGDQHELHQLQESEKRSPPALHAKNGAQVVRIHQHVNKRVQQHRNAVISSGVVVKEEGNNDSDAAVVIHVEEGHLAVGFAQDEEEGVNKLPVLLHVEYIKHVRDVLRIFTEEVNRAAKQRALL